MIADMIRLLAFMLLVAGWSLPAQAAVTITFWSHEFGKDFPHAFIGLRGVPDAGGPAVDTAVGFTAKAVTPAILLGNVAGKVETLKPDYVASSDVRFSVVLTDAQYADVVRLIAEWGPAGDSTYNLNKRNCVHFVQEAARRSGVAALDFPKLMKKPRSFLQAVASANVGSVTVVGLDGKAYLATLAPIAVPLPSAPAVAIAPPAPAAVPAGG